MRRTLVICHVLALAGLIGLMAAPAFSQTAGQTALRDEAHRDEGENRLLRDADWTQRDYSEDCKAHAVAAKVHCTDPVALGLGNLAFWKAEDYHDGGLADEFEARQLRVLTGLPELSNGDADWQIALDLQAIGDHRADDHFADAADHYRIASIAFDTSDGWYSAATDRFYSAAHDFQAAETHYVLGSGGGQGGGAGGGLFCVLDELHTVPVPLPPRRTARVSQDFDDRTPPTESDLAAANPLRIEVAEDGWQGKRCGKLGWRVRKWRTCRPCCWRVLRR